MISLAENEEQQPKQHPPARASVRPGTELRSATLTKLDTLPSFESIIRDTLLPYSHHEEEITFPSAYTLKKDSNFHEKVLSKLVEIETKIKTKIISKDI